MVEDMDDPPNREQHQHHRPSRAFFFLLLGLVAFAIFRLFLPWITAWVVALVVVITTYPLHRRLCHLLGGRRFLAAAVSTVLVLLLIAVPTGLLALGAANQAAGVLATTAKDQEEGSLQERVQKTVELLPYSLQRFIRGLDINPKRLTSMLLDGLQSASTQLAGLVGGLVNFLVFLGVVVFGVFYLYLDGEDMGQRLLELSPLPADTNRALATEIVETTRATMKSTLLLALFQGILDALGFWVLGLPLAWLWGAAAVVASTVPIMGAALIWVPAAIYLSFSQSLVMGLVLAAWCALVNLVTDNFLRPPLIGHGSGNHPLLVFAVVLGGITVFGLSGLILGPVILSVLTALVAAYRKHFAHQA
jgi:predicted PurR-regulated permease PerM